MIRKRYPRLGNVTDTLFTFRHVSVAADATGNCYFAWEDTAYGHVEHLRTEIRF